MKENFKELIDNLNLDGVSVEDIEKEANYTTITIYGGMNGNLKGFENWQLYIWQIQGMLLALNAWVISLAYSGIDSVWILKVGII